jgi:hypothetical protein
LHAQRQKTILAWYVRAVVKTGIGFQGDAVKCCDHAVYKHAKQTEDERQNAQ